MNRKLIGLFCVIVCMAVVASFFSKSTAQSDDLPSKIEMTQNKHKFEMLKNLSVSNNLQKYGINTLSANDEDFERELRGLIGETNFANNPVGPLANYLSVIVVNSSKKDIVGCSLRWEFTMSNGETKIFPQIQSTPGILMGIQPNPSMIGKTSLIGDGNRKFFSFDHNIDQTIMSLRNSSGNSSKFSFGISSESNVFDAAGNNLKALGNAFSKFAVSIDGIFFDDGTFVGNDEFYYFDSIQGQVKASSDFLETLLKLKDKQNELTTFFSKPVTKDALSRRSLSYSPSNSQDSFQRGYDKQMDSIRREISRMRSTFSDQAIADTYLRNRNHPIKLRKVN